MEHLCAKCQKNPRRSRGRYCLECAAAYMRDWRAKQATHRRATASELAARAEGLRDRVVELRSGDRALVAEMIDYITAQSKRGAGT